MKGNLRMKFEKNLNNLIKMLKNDVPYFCLNRLKPNLYYRAVFLSDDIPCQNLRLVWYLDISHRIDLMGISFHNLVWKVVRMAHRLCHNAVCRKSRCDSYHWICEAQKICLMHMECASAINLIIHGKKHRLKNALQIYFLEN